MALHSVILYCWLRGHKTDMTMTLRQEEALVTKIKKLKAVCPECRNTQLGNQSIFIQEGRTIVNPSKLYQCTQGHTTAVNAFTNGMLNVRFGIGHEDFVNIEGTIEELPEIIDSKEVVCHHVHDGQACDLALKPIDDLVLTYPNLTNIKTKTRIGDLWDRAGVEPVRTGTYDDKGNYQETKSQVANRERLKKIRDRNISSERQPGKRIDQATEKRYRRRSKSEVNPERLKAPK